MANGSADTTARLENWFWTQSPPASLFFARCTRTRFVQVTGVVCAFRVGELNCQPAESELSRESLGLAIGPSPPDRTPYRKANPLPYQ